ncbi:TetR/AcrR family transcriptional regulator [Gordonia sp. (in: high G+C Gram-positive bacteria)]|uniref:TetR/AcrR family transcriptional regulator n=1 Tax=Gordonia sp. (in: high G+C Gram-positive bacteria) TaxID=84139 RepID=UPI0016941811|nr:TetR/AcrR family transcriptional regulator [Gordonia sp. (in: high G+C Gram-positive bacteria)]NLG47734.1 TetR/AcrR family transcriptional regulator [Gordonia sp. (in: high G+C Gram-positive bacteria)]
MVSQQINDPDSDVPRRTAANAISADVILDAATGLMTTIGIRRTTMADVARAADVSRATLYRRFPNVEAIAAQVTTREFERVVATAPIADGPVDRASLVATVVHLVREARAHPLLQRIIDLDPEFLMPYLLHRSGRTSRGQLAVITEFLIAGQTSGEVRDGDPERLATTVLQMAWSFALTGPVFAGDDLDILDSELSDLLERYLRP